MSVCLYQRISLTAEPIWFSFIVNFIHFRDSIVDVFSLVVDMYKTCIYFFLFQLSTLVACILTVSLHTATAASNPLCSQVHRERFGSFSLVATCEMDNDGYGWCVVLLRERFLSCNDIVMHSLRMCRGSSSLQRLCQSKYTSRPSWSIQIGICQLRPPICQLADRIDILGSELI